MSAIPSRLNYEINEVEFNFRLYKFVMCSSFLLPFCMAGWSWQTCFVRRAAFEFWYNEALASSPVPPLISTHSYERETPLTVEVFTVENVYPFWLPGGRLLGGFFQACFPAEGAPPQGLGPRAVSSSGVSWLGWWGLWEDQKWALWKRGDEEHFKGENQIKSF